MKLREIFYRTLFDKQLHSYEDYKKGFELKKRFKIETLYKDASPILNATIGFTDELKKNLASIYSQTRSLFGWWEIADSVTIEKLDTIEWLKQYRINEEIEYDFMKELISGVIDIVPSSEILDKKKFEYLNRNGVRYLPFDRHYELAACFKVENNKVEDNIYILNVQDSEIIYDMGVGCIKYLELAYKAKLFYQWQYAYMNKQGIDNERLNTMLPVIFPSLELDLSDFN